MSDFDINKALKAAAKRNAENPPEPAATGRIDPRSPAERIKRAREQALEIEKQIDWMLDQPASDLRTQRLTTLLDRLGELRAEQGDYAGALEASVTPERRAHYAKLIEAIEAPDDARCSCPDDTEVDRRDKREFRSPAMMHSETIVLPDGSARDLRVCRKCGYMNAV
jgi:hypothetical protein